VQAGTDWAGVQDAVQARGDLRSELEMVWERQVRFLKDARPNVSQHPELALTHVLEVDHAATDIRAITEWESDLQTLPTMAQVLQSGAVSPKLATRDTDDNAREFGTDLRRESPTAPWGSVRTRLDAGLGNYLYKVRGGGGGASGAHAPWPTGAALPRSDCMARVTRTAAADVRIGA